MRPAIYTPRLILRPFAKGDLADFYQYCSDPAVGPMAGWKPHESLAESEQILNVYIQYEGIWAICLKESGKVIGSAGLHKDAKRGLDDVRMLGYSLSREYWGQGIMPEAARALMEYGFTQLQLCLISALHYSFNHQSRRVL